MPPLKPILLFCCRFLLIYGVLTACWLEIKEGYRYFFRTLGQTAFGENGTKRIVRFQPNSGRRGGNIDTLIDIANRELLDGNGRGHTIELSLDSRQVGWAPTTFLIALIIATPLGWRRRARALFWGLLCIHAFILFSLGLFIWNESTRLALVHLGPLLKGMVDGLEYIILTPAGPNFVVSALIWILVTFQSNDLPKQSVDGGIVDEMSSGKNAEKSAYKSA